MKELKGKGIFDYNALFISIRVFMGIPLSICKPCTRSKKGGKNKAAENKDSGYWWAPFEADGNDKGHKHIWLAYNGCDSVVPVMPPAVVQLLNLHQSTTSSLHNALKDVEKILKLTPDGSYQILIDKMKELIQAAGKIGQKACPITTKSHRSQVVELNALSPTKKEPHPRGSQLVRKRHLGSEEEEDKQAPVIKRSRNLTMAPLQCPCSKEFEEKEELEKHIQLSHKNNHWKCFYCPKTYKKQSLVWRHARINHFSIYQYHCPLANCTFPGTEVRGALQKHLSVDHLIEITEVLRCSKCEKNFAEANKM